MVMLSLRKAEPSRSPDPIAMMGLERILLHWLSAMAFVTISSLSLSLLKVESVSEKIVVSAVQYVWIALSVSGLLFSVWQYFVRQRLLEKGSSVDKETSSGLGSFLIVGVVVGNLVCVLVITFWLK